MTLKRNIVANYASQLYVTFVGILTVPLLIKYMGAEAYGLVGLFGMLQVWFNLLDMGLTPTIARESARYRGGSCTAHEYRRLARSLEYVFCAVALMGGIVLYALAEPIATGWLKASLLRTQVLTQALQLIAVIIALRWMSGLYRGVITGAERLVWLSAFNSIVATARFILVLPVLIYFSSTSITFFTFQLGVAMFELLGLSWFAYRFLPDIVTGQSLQLEWAALKPVLKFSLSIAFTSSVWVFVTQTDKLLLSKILPLADYGYFTVAVMVASGIMIVSSPVSSAIMPRMTRLEAEGKHDDLIVVYRQATQLVAVLGTPVALVLIFFAPQVLWAWTGSEEIVYKAAPILILYALGNGLLILSAFPYYLQFAKGNLRLHIIGNVIFLVILIPALIWATIQYGVIGSGFAWLCANFIYFLLWVPKVHYKFSNDLHKKWMIDVGLIVLVPSCAAALIRKGIIWPSDRYYISVYLVIVGFGLLCMASMVSTVVRNDLKEKYLTLTAK